MTIIKNYLTCLVIFIILLCGATPCVSQEKFPPHQGLVNDFAGVIPPEMEVEMRSRAREVLQKTGASIVVVTIPTLGENYISDYANKLYHAWGIGKKGEDRGVLILFVLKERKIRIETGYGLEGVLPDGRVGEILRNDMIPLLKEGQYGQGLLNGLKSVSAVIAASQNVELAGKAPEKVKRKKKNRRDDPLTSLIILAFFGLSLGSMILARRRGWHGPYGGYGGGYGGGSGGGDSGGFGGFGGGDSGGGGAEGDF